MFSFVSFRASVDEKPGVFGNSTSWVSIIRKIRSLHHNLGIAYNEQGKYGLAITQWHKVLEINPNDEETHDNLGLAYLNQRQFDKAIAQWKKVVEINPSAQWPKWFTPNNADTMKQLRSVKRSLKSTQTMQKRIIIWDLPAIIEPSMTKRLSPLSKL